MSDESLQAEVERLRVQVETYRQREMEQLRSQLAATAQERDHYKQEAYRNADLGRQIHAELTAELAKVRTELEVKRTTERALRNANAGRN